MHKKLSFNIFFIFITMGAFAQNLNIANLITLYKQATWEDANTYVSNKNWVYYNSVNESEIQWSYQKVNYQGKAQGWLTLKLDGAKFSYFRYIIGTSKLYSQLIAELKTLGFKKKSSSIRDGSLTTQYSNGKYNISTWISKAENPEDFDGNSYTIEIEKIRRVYYLDDNVDYETEILVDSTADYPEVTSTYTSSSANTHTDLTITAAGVDFEFQNIPAGTFSMGNIESDEEKPIHSVTLSAFSMMKYEVTQAQWQAVMGANPSNFQNCAICPVETVNWVDVQTYISKLNTLTGKTFRLPTESEWEYAALGGQNYTYAGNDDIDKVAWYGDNASNQTHPVGTKQGNGYGLYDMSGNVWEWCNDWHDDYPSYTVTNPQGASSGRYRVNRGGSWLNYSSICRLAVRSGSNPTNRFGRLGFRLVLVQ